MADEPRDDHMRQDELSADERARRQHELEELAVQVAEDPGSSAFPALAEGYRRAGLVAEARHVVERGLEIAPQRMAGRVALGLVLLEQGEVDAARRELMRVFDDAAPRPTEIEPEVERSVTSAWALSESTASEATASEALDEASEWSPEPTRGAPLTSVPAEVLSLDSHEPRVPVSEAPLPEAPVIGEAALTAEAELIGEAALTAEAASFGVASAAVRDDEIERALAAAESDSSAMVDVNDIAEQAMRVEALDGPDDDAHGADGDSDGYSDDSDVERVFLGDDAGADTGFDPEALPSFATETMAGLLERQGDVGGAELIRSSFDTELEVEAEEPGEEPDEVLDLGGMTLVGIEPTDATEAAPPSEVALVDAALVEPELEPDLVAEVGEIEVAGTYEAGYEPFATAAEDDPFEAQPPIEPIVEALEAAGFDTARPRAEHGVLDAAEVPAADVIATADPLELSGAAADRQAQARAQVVATLETWLENIRREVA